MNQRPGRGVWRWPLTLSALTAFGLLSALLGQRGPWWAASWCALAVPVAIGARTIARAVGRSPRRAPGDERSGAFANR